MKKSLFPNVNSYHSERQLLIKLFALIVALLLEISGFSQSVFENMDKVPILTPQAAAFSKYVEFPVSYYNGTSEISVALYTISAGDIQIPITLSYHSGGIKVAEEASWVGLGWNLNVGGVISRQVKGVDDFDFTVSKHYSEMFPAPSQPFSETETNKANYSLCNVYDVNGNIITTSMTDSELLAIHSGDGEPDIFMYNFGGYSGKFLHVEDNIDISRNNILFDVSSTGITAKTPDGFIYEFNMVEKGWVGQNPQAPMAYYLTKITSAKGNVLQFNYTTLSAVKQMPSFSEQYAVRYETFPGSGIDGSSGPLTWKRLYNSSNPVFLESIVWNNGSITFVKSTREDMEGKKLDKMVIQHNDGTVFNSISFTYDYFVATLSRHYEELGYPQSPDPELAYPVDYLRKRLKLLSVQEEGDGTVTASNYIKHAFEYYEGGNLSLPYKSSYACDFWGFYNGKTGNTHLIPHGKDLPIDAGTHTDIYNLLGANKKPDSEFTTACMLKKITYPTNGSTTYQYAIHNFTNSGFLPPQYRTVEVANILDTGVGTQEETFTIDRDFELDVWLFCDCTDNTCACSGPSPVWDCGNFSSTGYDPNVMYAQLLKFNTTTGNFEPISSEYTWDVNDILPCGGQNSNGKFTRTIDLGPGTYKVLANYPDNKTGSVGSKMAYMRAHYVEQYYDETSLSGGGVRISQITHYDPYRNITLSRSYSYESGLLMDFPHYFWRKPELQRLEGPLRREFVRAEYLYSNAITPYSTSANGSPVGYGKVTETITGGQNGRIEYEYDNGLDYLNLYSIYQPGGSTLYDFHAFAPGSGGTPRLRNGFVQEKRVYDNNGFPVSKTSNSSTIVTPRIYWAVKSERMMSPGEGVGSICTNDFSEVMHYFYPILIAKVATASTTETQFENGVAKINLTKAFQYNAQALLQRETLTGSDNKVRSTEYKYTKDYDNSGWMAGLYSKNILNVPLEVVSKLDGLVTGGGFTRYETVDGLTLPNEVFKIATSKPQVIPSTAPGGTIPSGSYETRIRIHSYDERGNLKCVSRNSGPKTSYLYGYNKTLPIAEIVNAEDTYKTFAQTTQSTGSYGITIGGVAPVTTSATFTVEYTGPVKLKLGMGGTPAYTTYADYSGISSGTMTLTNGQSCEYDVVTFNNVAPGTYTITIALRASVEGSGVGACGKIEYPKYVTTTTSEGAIEFLYEGFEESSVAGVVNNSTQSRTGNKYFQGDYTVNFVTPNSRTYVIEYWYLDANNEWISISKPYTGPSMMISEGSAIDDVRIHPVDSRMTTFTYDPLVGLTSSTDLNNLTTRYEYDEFYRLKLIRDNEGSILKKYTYKYSLSAGNNFLRDEVVQVKDVTDASAISSLAIGNKQETISYFDGLGRPLQIVNRQGSPAHMDIVQPVVYDEVGREAVKYLPYVSGSDGLYKTDFVLKDNANYPSSTQAQVYQTEDRVAIDFSPYSETIFDSSPLNRPMKLGSPGVTWQPNNNVSDYSDKTIKKTYQANGADEVFLFNYNPVTGGVIRNRQVNNGYYPANELYASRTFDEHNNEVIEYVDKEGRTVCKKAKASATEYASTYYIYDDFGSLVVVLPPMATEEVKDILVTYFNATKNGTFVRNNCIEGGGSSVVYTVTAGTYSSTISQADADQQAINDVNANGQAYANANGECLLFYNVQMSDSFTRNNCDCLQVGQSVTYTVPAGTYSSTISQADANQQAQNEINVDGQANANSTGQCYETCTAVDHKAIGCTCEQGVKKYISSAWDSNANQYLCTYHYRFSDGSFSDEFTEYANFPCPIE